MVCGGQFYLKSSSGRRNSLLKPPPPPPGPPRRWAVSLPRGQTLMNLRATAARKPITSRPGCVLLHRPSAVVAETNYRLAITVFFCILRSTSIMPASEGFQQVRSGGRCRADLRQAAFEITPAKSAWWLGPEAGYIISDGRHHLLLSLMQPLLWCVHSVPDRGRHILKISCRDWIAALPEM